MKTPPVLGDRLNMQIRTRTREAMSLLFSFLLAKVNVGNGRKQAGGTSVPRVCTAPQAACFSFAPSSLWPGFPPPSSCNHHLNVGFGVAHGKFFGIYSKSHQRVQTGT